MKKLLSQNLTRAGIMALYWTALSIFAASPRLVTQRDPALSPQGVGGGDSVNPIISGDSRFVLFASSAANLTVNSHGAASVGLVPSRLNVYLRDRTTLTNALVSVNQSGQAGGNGDSIPIEISADGRYALFESSASDLVANDTNGCNDIFVRDLVAGTTRLISINLTGGIANGASRGAVMTPDARYVAFVSAANNLILADTNAIPDIFVRDVVVGTTVCVSCGAAFGLNVSSESPIITPDGRYVAFRSSATNLIPGVSSTGEIYVRDLVGGQTFLASTNARAMASGLIGTTNLTSYNHNLSDDGKYVVFETSSALSNSVGVIFRYNTVSNLTELIATNAVSEPGFENARSLDLTSDGRFVAFIANSSGTPDGGNCVYRWDGSSNLTALVSADLSNLTPSNSICEWPVIDSTGRYISFFSTATNLTTNLLASGYNLYVRDLQAGTTLLVNADANGRGTTLNPTTYPSLSADARLITFESQDSTMVSSDSSLQNDVFIRDLVAGTNELISARNPSLPSLSADGPSAISFGSISTNGQFLAFSSRADNLVTNDTNGFRDVFLRDLWADTNLIISAVAANGSSFEPSVSGNGRWVAFTSAATNLVATDTNNALDVFVKDTLTGTTTLVSVNLNVNGPGNSNSFSPVISLDGRYVLFHSTATDLVPGFSSAGERIFLRDLIAATTIVMTNAESGGVATMTPDARYIVFAKFPKLYVYDSQLGQVVSTNNINDSPTSLSISPSGTRVALANSSQIAVYDLVSKTTSVLSSSPRTANPGLRFSADERYLVFATTNALLAADTNQNVDVYLHDFQTGTNGLISKSFLSPSGANGPSDSPNISANGRFVAYRSQATDLVPGATNGSPQIYLFDRIWNSTTLVSANTSTSTAGNGRSYPPVISADSHTMIFESWSGNLAPSDYNQSGDLFSVSLTSAAVSDSDGDGMDDAWEMQYFGTLDRNGAGDFDGDGASDLMEYQTGTDPTNPNSFFNVQIISTLPAGQGITISWPVAPGRNYRAQFKNNLADPGWQDLNSNISFIGSKGYAEDFSPDGNQRFYRIATAD